MRLLVALLAATALVGCAADPAADPAWSKVKEPISVAGSGPTARLLLVGDVMLGRSVAPIVAADPDGLFADVRHAISQADVAMFNLESPLTQRDHESDNPNVLEADPAGAALLASAGFDVADLANNHSGDAGLGGILDTLNALAGVGIRAVGVGRDAADVRHPLVVEVGQVRIGVVALDLTSSAPVAGTGPGLAGWNGITVETLLAEAHAAADVVVVGIHGGVEYRTEGSDPVLTPAVRVLAGLGADVVWGHGAHVVQPIETIADPVTGRATVAASSLGNFVFDQRSGNPAIGAVLEVLVDSDGVVAYRTGATTHADLRVEFLGWDPPEGSATVVDGAWWELVRVPRFEPVSPVNLPAGGFPYGDVFDAALGDLTGDGWDDLVVSYRYPFKENLANQGDAEYYSDFEGRAAHFGVFDPVTLDKIWAAGTVPRPIERLRPCDGVLGMAFSQLDDPTVVATGAAVWGGFGFTSLVDLSGAGELHCADVDRDGELNLIVTR